MYVLQLIRGKGERKFSRLTYDEFMSSLSLQLCRYGLKHSLIFLLVKVIAYSTVHVYGQIPFYKNILCPILKTSYRPPSTSLSISGQKPTLKIKPRKPGK